RAHADPTLYVITAAGPDQVAGAAPELRSSVFGHFLARALKGEGGGSDVSLAKLFCFVAARVDQYSQQRRGLSQPPTLWHGDNVYSVDKTGRLILKGGEAAHFDDFAVAYVDWLRRNATWQSAFDPLSEAKRLLGKSDAAAAEPTGSTYSLHQVWQRYRRRRQATMGESDGPA